VQLRVFPNGGQLPPAKAEQWYFRELLKDCRAMLRRSCAGDITLQNEVPAPCAASISSCHFFVGSMSTCATNCTSDARSNNLLSCRYHLEVAFGD
jgi:hypothetical protein